jgi:hypothetical protein
MSVSVRVERFFARVLNALAHGDVLVPWDSGPCKRSPLVANTLGSNNLKSTMIAQAFEYTLRSGWCLYDVSPSLQS